MSRLLLNYLLPLALPLTIYLTYIWWRRRHAARYNGDVPVIESNYIFISVLIGFLLMVSWLTWVAIISGSAPGEGGYQPPRYEDGKIIPPSFN